MDYIWIITFPPVYDGIIMTSPSYITIMTTEPTGSVLADLLAAGAKIHKVPKLDGGTTTISDNGSPVSLDYDEEDDTYTGDLSEDLVHEIDVDQSTDDADSTTSFVYNSGTNFVVGDSVSSLPLYAMSDDSETIYKVSNSTGLTLWSLNSADYTGIWNGTISNFVCSDDGYLYFFWIGEEGVPIETHTHLIVVDPDGNDSEALDIGNTSHQGLSMLAYDRATSTIYLEADDFPASGQTTLYTFSETGVASGSSTRDTSSLGYSFSGIAVYNGIVSYLAYDFSSGDDIIICDGVERFSTSGSMTGDILAPVDGYVYALYSDGGALHLIKIDPSGGVEWIFDLPPTSTTLNSGRNLFVNDSGYSMVTVDIGGISGTFVIDPDGNYFDGGPVNMRGIDNYFNYYTTP